MLTINDVRRARPRAAGYKLTDGAGLHLFVAPSGHKSWRLRFRFGGREQLLTIGAWPDVSIDEARASGARARALLDRGEDPRARFREAAPTRDFAATARRWHALMAGRWSAVHAADVLASLERDIFPVIGAMPIAAITAPVVLNALRRVEQRGCFETARRVRQRISAVFVFAMGEGLIDADPAAVIGKALQPPAPQRGHPAIVDPAEVRRLLAAVDQLDAAQAVTLASRFLALTAVRLAAVRHARWLEIEELDGPAPLWRVPAAHMKLGAAKKLSADNDHLVPLSPAAVAVLREARASRTCIPTMHIFPGRDDDAPIGEAAIGALYDRAGFAGRHVPHGWRASFSTILNERFPAERATIDRALAHAAKDKVEAAYNRSEQLAARRRLFEAWGEILTAP
ncbi:integrase [Sphingomonas jinjuensis]|uniref:Integrase n=1 Tax=Sphingomonas jinjuensis TaxID=535907 RepID=A0A840FHP6_9SPHN|nr:integrase arm-type DNA-binding domain-containing protein [Sphingomonas jinjuensis]MBB4152875.1 integrase [Sphingomonas jinjuensis]